MKHRLLLILCIVICSTDGLLQAQVIEWGPHYTHYKPSSAEPEASKPQGGYVQLGTGLNRRLVSGEWVKSEPRLEVVANGVLASGAPHTLLLAPNLNTEGAVEVTDPQGNIIKTHVYGLAFYDPITEETLLIAELQDSFAEIIEPNQVVFRNVSGDLAADVRFSYSPAGIEQDFILKQRPIPEAYGFSSETVQLLVLTEVLTKPQLVRAIAPGGSNEIARAIGENLYDESLSLGTMQLGRGKAFSTHAHPQGHELPSLRIREGAAVGKSRLQADNREFLVEAVNFADIAEELAHLPEGKPVAQLPGKKKKMSTLIAKAMPKPRGGSEKVMIASSRPPERGLVIDYALLNSSPDVILSGAITYYIDSALILTNLTILPGTVVKFSTNGSITVKGGVFCPGNDYLPSIFTSKDDDAAGSAITGSTGIPSGYYANPALYIQNNSSELRNIRIRDARDGIIYGSSSYGPHFLWHSEILGCERAIVANIQARFRNVLLFNNAITFHSTNSGAVTIHGENLTIHNTGVLNNSGDLSLKLTNSLIVSVTSTGNYSGAANVYLTSDNGVFKKVGAGEHYLADSSAYRDAGTTNIHRVLHDDLKKRTTYGPNFYMNAVYTNDLILEPSIERDLGLPDLGWHPPAIDYLTREIVMTNGATLTLTNGVAVASSGNFGFKSSGGIRSEGTSLKPNIVALLDMIQESRTNTMGGSTGSSHKVFDGADMLKLSFTEVLLGSEGGWHLFGPFTNLVQVSDSTFIGGEFIVSEDISATVSVHNSTFVQTDIYFGGTNLNPSFYNNTLIEAGLSIFSHAGSATWPFRDNLFDRSTFYTYNDPVDASFNAFHSSPSNATNGSNNVYLSSLYFEKGPLGDFYLPANHPIYTNGSRTASAAGLYHQTTRWDQEKAGTGQVSIGRHYVSCDTNQTVFVWCDDATPGDAYLEQSVDTWLWTDSPSSYSGSSNHLSALYASTHQHYFHGTVTNRMPVAQGDRLFCYIQVNAANPPTTIMLQWNVGDGSVWSHRAFWGSDKFTWSPRAFFGLGAPVTNTWSRLEVPAWVVDLEDKSVDPNGMAFTLFGGQANWDMAGVIRYTSNPILLDADGDGIADYLEDTNGDGNWNAGESDWTVGDSDEDGVSDGLEWQLGRNRESGATTDSNNSAALKVFTPLK